MRSSAWQTPTGSSCLIWACLVYACVSALAWNCRGYVPNSTKHHNVSCLDGELPRNTSTRARPFKSEPDRVKLFDWAFGTESTNLPHNSLLLTGTEPAKSLTGPLLDFVSFREALVCSAGQHFHYFVLGQPVWKQLLCFGGVWHLAFVSEKARVQCHGAASLLKPS